MGLYLVEVYRSPNIGVFLKTNDTHLLIPKGMASSKAEMLENDLKVKACPVSVWGSRLLGPLVVMNNRGALVSRMTEDYEIKEIASQTGLTVERLRSRQTATGNLVAANDRGAVVSPYLEPEAIKQITEVLGVDAYRMMMGQYYQTGALITATNNGAAVYPDATEQEVAEVGRVLGVEASPASVNSGIPFVASGLVANSKNAIAGSLTTGPELVFLTRALGV